MNNLNTKITFQPTHLSHRRFQLNHHNKTSKTPISPYQKNKSTLTFSKDFLTKKKAHSLFQRKYP